MPSGFYEFFGYLALLTVAVWFGCCFSAVLAYRCATDLYRLLVRGMCSFRDQLRFAQRQREAWDEFDRQRAAWYDKEAR